MRKHFFGSILLLTCLTVCSLAQESSEAALPITVQAAGDKFYFVAAAEVSGFRVALYDGKGRAVAAGEANDTPRRWQMRKARGQPLAAGVYLGVFWLREASEVTKRFARVIVQPNAVRLQTAEQYLQPAKSLLFDGHYFARSSPEHSAAHRRLYQHGVEAASFFRLATQVQPDETAAYLFLVQAIELKYTQYTSKVDDLLSPPPPPPPPPPPAPGSVVSMPPERVAVPPPVRQPVAPPTDGLPHSPTPKDRQEMLTAVRKAVAVAKTCAEKTTAQRWRAALRLEAGDQTGHLALLEQITRASCATNQLKAEMFYARGVLFWQCAFELSMRHADPKLRQYDPFHYRSLGNDQRKFTDCLQQATEALEKALALNPDYPEVWSYRSLLYREQTKTTAAPAERQKFSALADAAAKRAIELAAKQQRR